MRLENCIEGLRVKILSKSVGQPIEDLYGFRKGTILKLTIYNGVYDLMVNVPLINEDGEIEKQRFVFMSDDLEPLWEDDK